MNVKVQNEIIEIKINLSDSLKLFTNFIYKL